MRPAPELAESRHALVVATATYADTAFARLRAPAQDATAIAEVLADPAIGGFTVTEVLDRPEHEVRRRVDEFLAGRDRGDLILVYLSCHGVLDARGRLYLAATDTVKGRLSSTAIDSAWLLDRLDECRARQQVVILDCCFSGAFAGIKADTDLHLERRLVGAGRGRAVLTASRASEYSYEGAPLPGGAAPHGSVFTAALVDGLRSGGADRDNDGLISVEEAFIYAADEVRATGNEQTPQRWLYGGEGQIILAWNPRRVAGRPDVSTPPSIDQPSNPLVDPVGAPGSATGTAATTTVPRVATSTPAERQSSPDHLTTRPGSGKKNFNRLAVLVSVALLVLIGTVVYVKVFRLVITAEAEVRSIAISPDGKILAGALENGTAGVWHLSDQSKMAGPTSSLHEAWSVAFGPGGKYMAVAGRSGDGDKYPGEVHIWNLTDTGSGFGREACSVRDQPDTIYSIAFSPDGRTLATGGGDGTVRLWNLDTCERNGRPEQTGDPMTAHPGQVYGVAFSPNGKILASASSSGYVDHANPRSDSVQIWDVASQKQIGGHLAPTVGFAIAFSPDSSVLASGGSDGVRFWDTANGKQLGDFVPGQFLAIAFSPDGRILATGSGSDHDVRLWTAATHQQYGDNLSGHVGIVNTVAFSPDGKTLASGSSDHTIRLWDVATD